MRVTDVCTVLRTQGREVNTASVRKALHDRSRAERASPARRPDQRSTTTA